MVLSPLKTGKSFRFISSVLDIGHRLAHGSLELVCPSGCAVCRSELADGTEVLCRDCWQELQENLEVRSCPMCGHNVGEYALIDGRCHRCQNRRPVVERVARVGDYNNTMRELILGFKFRRQSHLDNFLGSMLASAIIGSAEYSEVDMLVPIPLHWRRRWSRRYDQAELLTCSTARYLVRQGRVIPICRELVRIRNTPPQTSLATTDRLINLRGAFAVCRGADFAGKHVCLIDDVSTTGTTLRVAAQTLKKAGARNISAAVLAVASNEMTK